MTVTIELSPERELQLKRYAESKGLTIEEVFLKATEHLVPTDSIWHLQETNPEEWARQFREWAESHDPNTPVLSDEAMSRESIYAD